MNEYTDETMLSIESATEAKNALLALSRKKVLTPDVVLLEKEIKACELLGNTEDGKQIYLFHYQHGSSIMREIRRLRELTFCVAGGGTGRKQDHDQYDSSYMHLVLWDEARLEIVGGCRLCDTNMVLSTAGLDSIYTSSSFVYNKAMKPYLYRGLELGKSFVQPGYWGKRSPEYLWYCVGSLLKRNPQYRYLFGSIGISNSYSQDARDLLVYFYTLYFGVEEKPVTALNPYQMERHQRNRLEPKFKGDDYKSDFEQLKLMLGMQGHSVPTIYKEYTEACEQGGVIFSDFNIDTNCSDCVDGFVIIDIDKLKADKRKRYLGE